MCQDKLSDNILRLTGLIYKNNDHMVYILDMFHSTG
jgi:hypothetical protein